MGKKETKEVSTIISKCEGRLKLFKVENMVGAAMPDVVGENRKGAAFWFEAKHLEKLPVRESTPPLRGAFEKGQLGWGASWRSWGGHAFVVVIVGSGSSKDYFLFVSEKGLDALTKKEFLEKALVSGFENIVSYLEGLK